VLWFFSPWWWWCVPPKRQFLKESHGVSSQKTKFYFYLNRKNRFDSPLAHDTFQGIGVQALRFSWRTQVDYSPPPPPRNRKSPEAANGPWRVIAHRPLQTERAGYPLMSVPMCQAAHRHIEEGRYLQNAQVKLHLWAWVLMYHAMGAYGQGGVAPQFLTSTLDGAVGSIFVSLYLRRNSRHCVLYRWLSGRHGKGRNIAFSRTRTRTPRKLSSAPTSDLLLPSSRSGSVTTQAYDFFFWGWSGTEATKWPVVPVPDDRWWWWWWWW
jgi:hypothetical protein